jgi:hypothetical protein
MTPPQAGVAHEQECQCHLDPAAVARVARLMRKLGWPPSDEDVERWRRKHQQSNDLDAAA